MLADKIYLLYHIRKTGELLLIGAYGSEADADAAIERLRGKPGFIDYPNDFEYYPYELNVDNFPEGFTDDGDDKTADDTTPDR
jgi:hypothetical protein